MAYPQSIEYNDAVQDPRSFLDPELKTGNVATTPLGLPLALSGGFALTYTIEVGHKKLAVRCFHKEVPDAQNRYAKISAKLRSLGSSGYFVSFDFQQQGIRIKGAAYPIVKMEWAEGQTLGVCLDRVSTNAITLNALRNGFSTLAGYLEANGVAHGDIQNENVIVNGSSIKLIDYDGMYVSGLPEGRGTEVGHKHFQHPGRDTKLFGPKMDRFSFIVLDVSLEALQADPSLHPRFREGGNAIIFNANDFASPTNSEVFGILRGMPGLRLSAEKLAAICEAPVSSIPSLDDFRTGRNIPVPKTTVAVTKTKPAPPSNYIGAFPVVDGEDFNLVMKRVGDKVELVGKIVSVKHGVGRRGRGRGLPYVFINFGAWNRESVKITIWSEGLGNISSRPNESWVGKWISVTGLIDPPYHGQHYGRPYSNVGIAVVSDNQIIRIEEREAAFRLGRGGAVRRQGAQTVKPDNSGILKTITVGSPPTPPTPAPKTQTPLKSYPRATQAPTSTAQTTTKNTRILEGLRPTPPPQTPSPSNTYNPPPSQTYRPSLLSRIPKWIWVVLALGLLRLILMRH